MFTVGALFLMALLAWAATRGGRKDYDKQVGDQDFVPLVIRQELKLALYMLAAIIVFLGVIADRLFAG